MTDQGRLPVSVSSSQASSQASLDVSNLTTPNKTPSRSRSTTPSKRSNRRRHLVESFRSCIPSAINDPRLGKPAADFFTRDWGDGFVATAALPGAASIPRVSDAKLDACRNRLGRVRPPGRLCVSFARHVVYVVARETSYNTQDKQPE